MFCEAGGEGAEVLKLAEAAFDEIAPAAEPGLNAGTLTPFRMGLMLAQALRAAISARRALLS